VLGASFDNVAANKAFCDKFAYPYKLLSFDKSAGKVWGATDDKESDWARRISYLIGPDRRIVKVYPKVKPAEHTAQVLADIPG
jgi:thioredoxin-dependent peroxiredoxin